jgi:hypothetical protein
MECTVDTLAAYTHDCSSLERRRHGVHRRHARGVHARLQLPRAPPPWSAPSTRSRRTRTTAARRPAPVSPSRARPRGEEQRRVSLERNDSETTFGFCVAQKPKRRSDGGPRTQNPEGWGACLGHHTELLRVGELVGARRRAVVGEVGVPQEEVRGVYA